MKMNERKTIDMGHIVNPLGTALELTWGITYIFDRHPAGAELFTRDGRSLGRWRAEDASREFLGWET